MALATQRIDPRPSMPALRLGASRRRCLSAGKLHCSLDLSAEVALAAPDVDRALDLPAQDVELVAKDEDLNLGGLVGAMVRCDDGEQPTKHQIDE
jgi:hypothetical protein